MTDPKHTINLLTFSHPEKELTFGFKLKKENGHSPLRKGEFPKELWKKHEKELSNTQRLYCETVNTKQRLILPRVSISQSIIITFVLPNISNKWHT